MSTLRKNTVVVDVSVLPYHSKAAAVKEFLAKQIKLDWQYVKNIQLHNIRNCVFIEMRDAETAIRLANEHNLQHSIEHENIKYRIPVYIEDGAINVRVHDLPPQLPDEIVAQHMRQYGEVISITDEIWKNHFPGFPNCVRVVRMKVSHPIPSYIVVGNEATLVTHKNQVPTCKHCGLRVHPNLNCSAAGRKHKLAATTIKQKEIVSNKKDAPTSKHTGELPKNNKVTNEQKQRKQSRPIQQQNDGTKEQEGRQHTKPESENDSEVPFQTVTRKRNRKANKMFETSGQGCQSDGSSSGASENEMYDESDVDKFIANMEKKLKKIKNFEEMHCNF